jgi:hypothetical protein
VPVRAILPLVFVALLGGAACGDDAEEPVSATAGEPYAVLHAEGWALQEAIDPPADDPFSTLERPPLAWYAEYVRTAADASDMVRLSGHDVPVDETRAELEALGFSFDETDLERWAGLVGTNPADAVGPAVVLLDGGDVTFMALSYELGIDELAALVDGVEGVDRAAWVAAGGVVR